MAGFIQNIFNRNYSSEAELKALHVAMQIDLLSPAQMLAEPVWQEGWQSSFKGHIFPREKPAAPESGSYERAPSAWPPAADATEAAAQQEARKHLVKILTAAQIVEDRVPSYLSWHDKIKIVEEAFAFFHLAEGGLDTSEALATYMAKNPAIALATMIFDKTCQRRNFSADLPRQLLSDAFTQGARVESKTGSANLTRYHVQDYAKVIAAARACGPAPRHIGAELRKGYTGFIPDEGWNR